MEMLVLFARCSFFRSVFVLFARNNACSFIITLFWRGELLSLCSEREVSTFAKRKSKELRSSELSEIAMNCNEYKKIKLH